MEAKCDWGGRLISYATGMWRFLCDGVVTSPIYIRTSGYNARIAGMAMRQLNSDLNMKTESLWILSEIDILYCESSRHRQYKSRWID